MRRFRASPAREDTAGSLDGGEPEFLVVGKLRHAHGVHGEILMQVLTDFPERLVPGSLIYVGPDARPMRLVRTRRHREGLLVTFEEYTNPEDAGQLRNQLVYVRAADRPELQEGEYYQHQLIGLHVSTSEGEAIGLVTEILETGASDVLVVHPGMGQDVLIPMVGEFVKNVDLSTGEITVTLIPGMRGEQV